MTEAEGGQVRAGLYCRLSLAVMGDTTKIEDQERICRELADRRGWQVADGVGYPAAYGAYLDNSKSAWKRSVRRPGWEAMLADVEAGRITAIVAYHGDRLVRQPRDLEKLIDLAEGRGIPIASPTGTRNLDNRDDRAMARVVAAFAENEAAATSDRRKAQYERWRRAGRVRPGGRGGRAFGFETDGMIHVPAECEVIRDAAARVLRGESTGSIARSVTMLTPAGSQMTDGTLRKMLARPRYAGLMPDGVHQAAWQPVLDRGTWEMVCAILSAKAAGFGYATNARRWLLSGIAICGECWNPLQIRQSRGRSGRPPQIGYGCVHEGCRKVHRSAALLDEWVIGWVIYRLNHADNEEPELHLHDGAAAELASLTTRRAETEAFIASLADAPAQRIEVLNRALDSFDAKIAAIRERMTGDSASRLRAQYAGITREEFDALPLDVRRALVRACYQMTVKRASRRGPGFCERDVTIVPV